MAERGIREQAITLAGATVRTAMADFKGQAITSAGDGILMGKGRVEISVVGGNN